MRTREHLPWLLLLTLLPLESRAQARELCGEAPDSGDRLADVHDAYAEGALTEGAVLEVDAATLEDVFGADGLGLYGRRFPGDEQPAMWIAAGGVISFPSDTRPGEWLPACGGVSFPRELARGSWPAIAPFCAPLGDVAFGWRVVDGEAIEVRWFLLDDAVDGRDRDGPLAIEATLMPDSTAAARGLLTVPDGAPLDGFVVEFRYAACDRLPGRFVIGFDGGPVLQDGDYVQGDGQTLPSREGRVTSDPPPPRVAGSGVHVLCRSSNVGVPGVWRYRFVDGQPCGCGLDADLAAARTCGLVSWHDADTHDEEYARADNWWAADGVTADCRREALDPDSVCYSAPADDALDPWCLYVENDNTCLDADEDGVADDTDLCSPQVLAGRRCAEEPHKCLRSPTGFDHLYGGPMCMPAAEAGEACVCDEPDGSGRQLDWDGDGAICDFDADGDGRWDCGPDGLCPPPLNGVDDDGDCVVDEPDECVGHLDPEACRVKTLALCRIESGRDASEAECLDKLRAFCTGAPVAEDASAEGCADFGKDRFCAEDDGDCEARVDVYCRVDESDCDPGERYCGGERYSLRECREQLLMACYRSTCPDGVDNDRDGQMDEAGEDNRWRWPGADVGDSAYFAGVDVRWEDLCPYQRARGEPDVDWTAIGVGWGALFEGDNDRDAIGDGCDPDDDNDGVSDCGDDGLCDPLEDGVDNDFDGRLDEADEDVNLDGPSGFADGVDNDGDAFVDEWAGEREAGLAELYAEPDPDEDNCPRTPNADQLDSDADGIGDACDPDVDGDGFDDISDNCPTTPNPEQNDRDGDGEGDACDDSDGDGVFDAGDNCPDVSNPGQYDNEDDGTGDLCDADDDNDDVSDEDDNCQRTANGDQLDLDADGIGDACDDDRDGDGVPDVDDNCPDTPIPNQDDRDRDGEGDVCDDTDGDGIVDADDNCPDHENPVQEDTWGTDAGDVCDDTDEDGFVDVDDNCPEVANSNQADMDGDGVGDACDDSDGDGYFDHEDNCPRDWSGDDQADLDEDGIGDVCDDDRDGDGILNDDDNCPNHDNVGQEDTWGTDAGDACEPQDDRSQCRIERTESQWLTGDSLEQCLLDPLRTSTKSLEATRPSDVEVRGGCWLAPGQRTDGWGSLLVMILLTGARRRANAQRRPTAAAPPATGCPADRTDHRRSA